MCILIVLLPKGHSQTLVYKKISSKLIHKMATYVSRLSHDDDIECVDGVLYNVLCLSKLEVISESIKQSNE